MALHLDKITISDIRTPINEIPLKELDITTDDWEPEAGMMGTDYSGSDRWPLVCVKVISPKRVAVVTNLNFTEESITTDPNIMVDENGIMWLKDYTKFKESIWEYYSKRKDGSWRKMNSTYSSPIHFGAAEVYRDPSF